MHTKMPIINHHFTSKFQSYICVTCLALPWYVYQYLIVFIILTGIVFIQFYLAWSYSIKGYHFAVMGLPTANLSPVHANLSSLETFRFIPSIPKVIMTNIKLNVHAKRLQLQNFVLKAGFFSIRKKRKKAF